MDKVKARALLAGELGKYRTKPYAALKKMVGQVDAFEVVASDGPIYQIEIQVLWDDVPGVDVRVMGAIDDGGWSAFSPMSDDFIMTPDGKFLD